MTSVARHQDNKLQDLCDKIDDDVDQESIIKLLAINENVVKTIIRESSAMDDQNFIHKVTYEGTKPIEDSKLLHREAMMQKIGLTTRKSKNSKKDIYVYKLDLEDNINEDDNKMLADPFITYGHGLMSFFRLLKF